MNEMDQLRQALKQFAGMDDAAFGLSVPYWQVKTYKKGEFYNEYKNICKHLGFILEGVFRTYHVNDQTNEEKNILFYSKGQVIVAYKSFLTQSPCNYYTESLTDARVLYIHIENLHKLYQESHQWEHLGRLLAEQGLNIVMNRTEDFLFKTPETRYLELMQEHPDVFNAVPLYHISSYLGIQGPSLSRIRKRLSGK